MEKKININPNFSTDKEQVDFTRILGGDDKLHDPLNDKGFSTVNDDPFAHLKVVVDDYYLPNFSEDMKELIKAAKTVKLLNGDQKTSVMGVQAGNTEGLCVMVAMSVIETDSTGKKTHTTKYGHSLLLMSKSTTTETIEIVGKQFDNSNEVVKTAAMWKLDAKNRIAFQSELDKLTNKILDVTNDNIVKDWKVQSSLIDINIVRGRAELQTLLRVVRGMTVSVVNVLNPANLENTMNAYKLFTVNELETTEVVQGGMASINANIKIIPNKIEYYNKKFNKSFTPDHVSKLMTTSPFGLTYFVDLKYRKMVQPNGNVGLTEQFSPVLVINNLKNTIPSMQHMLLSISTIYNAIIGKKFFKTIKHNLSGFDVDTLSPMCRKVVNNQFVTLDKLNWSENTQQGKKYKRSITETQIYNHIAKIVEGDPWVAIELREGPLLNRIFIDGAMSPNVDTRNHYCQVIINELYKLTDGLFPHTFKPNEVFEAGTFMVAGQVNINGKSVSTTSLNYTTIMETYGRNTPEDKRLRELLHGFKDSVFDEGITDNSSSSLEVVNAIAPDTIIDSRVARLTFTTKFIDAFLEAVKSKFSLIPKGEPIITANQNGYATKVGKAAHYNTQFTYSADANYMQNGYQQQSTYNWIV